jgi:hypothetical protein
MAFDHIHYRLFPLILKREASMSAPLAPTQPAGQPQVGSTIPLSPAGPTQPLPQEDNSVIYTIFLIFFTLAVVVFCYFSVIYVESEKSKLPVPPNNFPVVLGDLQERNLAVVAIEPVDGCEEVVISGDKFDDNVVNAIDNRIRVSVICGDGKRQWETIYVYPGNVYFVSIGPAGNKTEELSRMEWKAKACYFDKYEPDLTVEAEAEFAAARDASCP